MAIELWESDELYDLRTDPRMDRLPSDILDMYFTEPHYSEDKKIRFADLPEADRFMAPFVLPYENGKPIYTMKGETVESFLPPYIKLTDGVRPTDARNVRPSDIFRNQGQMPSLAARFDQRTAEVAEAHTRAVKVREIWMAVRALVDGKVQIDYAREQGAANPSVELNFGRDAGHTVTLSADYWDDPDTDILGDVESWMNTMYLAEGGGSADKMLVGAQVASLFRKNKGIKDALDTTYRGNNTVQIDLGIQRTEQPMKYIGRLDTGLEIWSYKDTVDIPNGSSKTKIDLFNQKDILLTAPGVRGVRAYGAIYDVDAFESGLGQIDIFQKMFKSTDGSEAFLQTASSPLPIPLYPNRTFKARVLA